MIETIITRKGKTFQVIKQESNTVTYIELNIKSGEEKEVHSHILPSDKIDKINII